MNCTIKARGDTHLYRPLRFYSAQVFVSLASACESICRAPLPAEARTRKGTSIVDGDTSDWFRQPSVGDRLSG